MATYPDGFACGLYKACMQVRVNAILARFYLCYQINDNIKVVLYVQIFKYIENAKNKVTRHLKNSLIMNYYVYNYGE